MSTIKSIHAYEIIDSKGLPTIEARLILDDDKEVVTSIPASFLSDKKSIIDLKDEDPHRFNGMGVTHAVSYINDLINPKLKGASIYKQKEIDQWMIDADGTKNKSRLGANTILTVSQLISKAGAKAQNMPDFKYINYLYSSYFKENIALDKIPTPIFNMINGGKHANNKLDFQEFAVVPSSSLTFSKAYQIGVEILYELKKVLEYRNATTAVGEEGGFSPNLTTNYDALEILNETIVQRQLKMGVDIFLGIDMSSSFFYSNNYYSLKDKNHPLKKDEYLKFIQNIIDNYSVIFLEDIFADEDWDGWKELVGKFPNTIYIVGDDLVRMSKDRLTKAIKNNSISTVTIKPSQAGTILEVLELINIARINHISYIVSSGSSETNDSFIADLSVGVQSEFVKFGSSSRGERVSKYNRLWQIEREELFTQK